MSAPFAHPVSSNSPSTLPGSESPAPSCSPISLQPNTSPTGPDASNESSPITPAFPTYNNADGKWYKSFASLHSHTGNLNVLNQTFVPTLEQQQLLAESLDANLGIWSSPREGNVEDEPVNCSSSDAVVMTTSFLDTMMNAQQPSGLQQKEDYIHEQMFQSPRWVPNGMIGANTNTDIPVAPHGHSQTYQSEYTSYEWPPLNYVHPPQWTEPINMAGNLPEGDTVLPPPNGHLGDYNSLQQHRYNHSIRAAHDYARWVNMEQHKLPHVLSPLHRTLPPLRIPAPIPSSEVQCDERPKPCVTPGGQFAKLPEKVLQMIIERLTLLSYTVKNYCRYDYFTC